VRCPASLLRAPGGLARPPARKSHGPFHAGPTLTLKSLIIALTGAWHYAGRGQRGEPGARLFEFTASPGRPPPSAYTAARQATNGCSGPAERVQALGGAAAGWLHRRHDMRSGHASRHGRRRRPPPPPANTCSARLLVKPCTLWRSSVPCRRLMSSWVSRVGRTPCLGADDGPRRWWGGQKRSPPWFPCSRCFPSPLQFLTCAPLTLAYIHIDKKTCCSAVAAKPPNGRVQTGKFPGAGMFLVPEQPRA
jgi:hypothetical protein